MSRFVNKSIAALDAYVPGEQPKNVSQLLKLNTNESPYPPSPKVRAALTEKSVADLRLYSSLTAPGLINALSDNLGVSPRQIALGNGSDEVIYFAMLAFGENGVTFPDITYGFYTVWASLIGIPQRIMPLRDDFTIATSDYQQNDMMVMIANPNAPTGIPMPLSYIEKILAANPDRIVLIDEAYVDFGGESAVPLIAKYDNLLVCRTFSKSRQMAGARLGFIVGSESVIADIEKIRFSINPYNVNSLTQALGQAAVEDQSYFNWATGQIIATREWTSKQLTELGFKVLPSASNFIFAKPGSISGADYMLRLRELGIVVRRFDADRIRDYLRITIGTREQMEQFIQVTKEIIK